MRHILSHQRSPSSTSVLLQGIWRNLSRRRRVQLGMLVGVMLLSAVAELVSLGAVLPFLSVLTAPRQLWNYSLVQEIAIRVGYTEPSQLLLPATLVFIVAVALAAIIRLVNLWLNGKLAAAVGSDLSCEAYRRTLYQPYEVHVRRNSAAVIAGATSQIALTVIALDSVLQLITSVIVAAGLLTGLLLIDLPVALSAAALFGTSYGVLAIKTRRELRINGQKIAEATRQQLKALHEGLGAIRDVILDGSQSIYLETYRHADCHQRRLQAKNGFLITFPRYTLEALGMVAIALLGSLLVNQRGGGADVIPLLGAMALGAQRLLPSLQQIYSSWSSLNGYSAAVEDVLGLLSQPLPPQMLRARPIQLNTNICLEAVHFSYGLEQPEILRGMSLEIRRGERIALIGSTGSGKSTMVDLLMGLLAPTAGRLLVDGVDLHDPEYPERLVAWREAIAHVPQDIYLSDSSFAQNIAFGVPLPLIDMDRVKKAAKQAKISSFIENGAEGYRGFVGERGVRLSGGQRQRIGIARALYKHAQVLVFDEATSALDGSTEKSIIESIERLSRGITIIMIAHRLSSIAGFDRIIKVQSGVAMEVVDLNH